MTGAREHPPAEPRGSASPAREGAPAAPVAHPAVANAVRVNPASIALLKVETGLRQVRTFKELTYFIANEMRPVARAQQVFVVSVARGARHRLRTEAVSSLSTIDRAAPLVVAIEHRLSTIARDRGLKELFEFDASGAGEADASDALSHYPLGHLMWVPFSDLDGALLGGMLLARAQPWSEADVALAHHLGGAASFAWLAVSPNRRRGRLAAVLPRRVLVMAGVASAALLFVPVSMSALAPVEVAPRGAHVVTAGIDGVVEAVDIDPNAPVAAGDVLVRIADTQLRNRAEIASREVVVAEAEARKAAQLAFVDIRGRHDLALAQAELDLKRAERDYAKDLLERATVRAGAAGIAVFGDKKDLIGKPVAMGEKLMEIVDPSALEFRIDLGAADAIVLKEGARVTVFLDSDPLSPVEARLVRADYRARVRDNQQLAFRLVAEVPPEKERALRLGVRGTAEIYSEKVPLGFYLLRRPIASLRQMIGW